MPIECTLPHILSLLAIANPLDQEIWELTLLKPSELGANNQLGAQEMENHEIMSLSLEGPSAQLISSAVGNDQPRRRRLLVVF